MAKGSYRGGSTVVNIGDLARQTSGPVTPIEAARAATAEAREKAATEQAAIRAARERAESLPPYEMDDEEARYWRDEAP